MRLKSIILLSMILVGSVYADSDMLKAKESNTTQELVNSEIMALKEKIKKLELELETYKKVKPIASKAIVPLKPVVTLKAKKRKKFKVRISEPTKLTAYYKSNPQSVDDLKLKLEMNGFKVLAVDEIFKNKTVISFTNDKLLHTNSFLSVLHMAVIKDVEIRVQNPSYFGAAFLQDKFKYGQFMDTLKALELTLGEMYEVEDNLKLSDLSTYHFMLGMPHFNDFIILARGSDIVEKVKESNLIKNISYMITLPNGATLLGHKLKHNTYKYLKKIEAQKNVQIFPYEVMIKDNKAFMLSPKYYLALSLPLLSMTDFLKIASAPEEIKKDIKLLYMTDKKSLSDK